MNSFTKNISSVKLFGKHSRENRFVLWMLLRIRNNARYWVSYTLKVITINSCFRKLLGYCKIAVPCIDFDLVGGAISRQDVDSDTTAACNYAEQHDLIHEWVEDALILHGRSVWLISIYQLSLMLVNCLLHLFYVRRWP